VVALTVTDVVGIERSALLTRVIVVVVLTVLAAVVVVIVGFGDGDLSHLALGIALLVYAVVSTAVLAELGSAALASATAPLTDAVVASGFGTWAPVGCRWRGRRGTRLAARLDSRGVPHGVGDGP
jgi:APA family basic amino acid/polyamine antiporter